MPAGMTDEAWIMEALLSHSVHVTFTPSLTSERSASLRCSFLHAIEGQHPISGESFWRSMR